MDVIGFLNLVSFPFTNVKTHKKKKLQVNKVGHVLDVTYKIYTSIAMGFQEIVQQTSGRVLVMKLQY